VSRVFLHEGAFFAKSSRKRLYPLMQIRAKSFFAKNESASNFQAVQVVYLSNRKPVSEVILAP